MCILYLIAAYDDILYINHEDIIGLAEYTLHSKIYSVSCCSWHYAQVYHRAPAAHASFNIASHIYTPIPYHQLNYNTKIYQANLLNALMAPLLLPDNSPRIHPASSTPFPTRLNFLHRLVYTYPSK